jgi:Tfp pilus assembly protein PilF
MILKFCRRPFVFLLIASAEFSCQKKAVGPPPRYAVVRFENLSGDPSLEWAGRAASELLPVSLAGAMDGPVLNAAALERLAPLLGARPAAAPGISSERAQAVLAGATRIFSGYVDRAGGAIRVVANEEDVPSGKSLRVVSAEDASFLDAIVKLAREVSPRARPLPTGNENAARLFASALETPADAAKGDLEQATRMDPDFGPAWLALARVEMVQSDRSAAASVIDQARLHKLDALTLAGLDLEAAMLKGEPAAARIAAERRIAALSPADTTLLRSVAQSEIEAGEFAAGAADWKKLTDALPGDSLAWNSLGYARSYAGDYAGALAAFREYARLRPADANPLDSMGDLNYSYRKFGEAAASYLQASAKNPAFERYGDLYKAAWAKFNAGDRAGADALFEKFRAARDKANDPLTVLFAADWLYRTGHPEDGVKSLRQAVASTAQAALRANGYSQLAVWDLLAGDRAKAAADAAAAGPVASTPALIARFSALPSAPPAEWETRAERMLAGPAVAGLRQLALGYALLLDGKREAALPVWGKIAAQTRATDFFIHAIDTRLRGKQLDHPLLPDPNAFNQFAALPERL